jgi:hypothetical protein
MDDERKFDWKDGISLKEYVDLRFTENQRALEKAERDLSKRLEGMNEFRDALKDQAGTFVTREAMEIKLDGLEKDMADLKLTRAHAQGKASQTSVLIAYGISFVGLLIAVLSFLKSV